jgi:hypothetical protein
MDEILGFLPPVANPPSPGIMLRMLKQRALSAWACCGNPEPGGCGL